MANNLIFSQIDQRLPYSKKDKSWRKDVVDSLCAEGNRKTVDNAKLQENYDLYNSQLTPDMFRDICDTLSLDDTSGKKYIEKFNILHSVINAFVGEEIQRPFGLSVINNNKGVVNEVLRERDFKFRKYVESSRNMIIERIKSMAALDKKYKESEQSQKPMSTVKYKVEIEEINNALNEKYKYELDPAKFTESIKNIITVKEETVGKLTKLLLRELKIKYVKNKSFNDVLKADREYIEIKPNRANTMPTLRDLNVLNVYHEDSENVEFIQDRNFAGYIESMPYADVITAFDLSESEIKSLSAHSTTGVYGTDDEMFRKKGLGPNDWSTKTNAGQFTNNIPFGVDGGVGTLPNYSSSTSYVQGKGLNAEETSKYNNNRYCTVYTNYWVSQRKVGFYTFQNEFGELDEEIVPESFPVPKEAEKEKFIPEEDIKNLFVKKSVRHVWYDEEDKYHAIEWKWLPEIWQGTRINDKIYKNVQPVQHAYQSLLDPYKKKLPIYGKIFNNRNTYSQSLTDRLKPWYKMYLIMMSKLLKNITNDRGVLTFINISMVDDEIGWENTIKLLEENGLVPYNPFNKTQGTNYSNTAKIAERLDATNSGSSQYYIQMLEFIEQKIKNVADMSDQRMAQVKQGTGSQVNQQATTESHKTSEILFMKHDVLWEQIMQGLLEMSVSMLNNSTGTMRGFLSNEEIALINLDNVSLEDEYLLSLQMNNKMLDIVRDSYQMIHAMFQNDKIDLLTMINLLEQEDTGALKSELRIIKAKQDEMDSQQQEAEAAKEKEMLQLEIDNREDMQIAKLDEISLKGQLDYNESYMKSQMLNASFDEEKDYNKDGIKDYMQLEQLNQRIKNETDKTQIARETLMLEKAKAGDKTNTEREKLSQTKVKDQQDGSLKSREIAEKKRANTIKQKQQSNRT